VNNARSLQTATVVNGVDQQPRFVVERLPDGPIDTLHPGPGVKYFECAVDQVHYRYRVTTIAAGASAGAKKSADTRVVLQARNPLLHVREPIMKRISSVILIIGMALFAGRVLAFTVADKPLFVTGNVEPNIILTLDDSGSMSRAFTPDVCDNPRCDLRE
jgi:hypothetical protein